jgi:modification methylase
MLTYTGQKLEFEEMINQVICGDCLEVMKHIPDKSVDLVLTSPPYENISGAGYSAKTKDILFLKLYCEFLDKVFKEYYRILKNTGQMFINLKSRTFNKTLRTPHWIEFTDGFQLFKFKSYIIWKYSGSFDSSFKRLHLDYEIIYHLSKTDNIFLNSEGKDALTSVWYISHHIKERLHPVQMPIKVADKIIKLASKEKEIVLDNFLGSGTTAVACKELGRRFIGIEISKEYCEIAERRLLNTQESMF